MESTITSSHKPTSKSQAIIFALVEVIFIDIFAAKYNPQWWWDLWTSFGGFVFSYLRQQTGRIIAPAIVHGLPQALVYLFIKI
jgi:membrane protease YdiL (CAAX protease family)